MVLQKNYSTHPGGQTRNVSVLETGFTGQTDFLVVGIQQPEVFGYF
jgi:hypothetical protein